MSTVSSTRQHGSMRRLRCRPVWHRRCADIRDWPLAAESSRSLHVMSAALPNVNSTGVKGLSDSPPCAALLLLAGIRGSTVAILLQARALPQKQSLICDNPCIMLKPVATHLTRRSKSGGTSSACTSRCRWPSDAVSINFFELQKFTKGHLSGGPAAAPPALPAPAAVGAPRTPR